MAISMRTRSAAWSFLQRHAPSVEVETHHQGHSAGCALDDTLEYYYAQHFCIPPTGTIYKNPTISIVRRRLVGDGFVEELTVLNHGTEAKEVELRWMRAPISPTYLRSKMP